MRDSRLKYPSFRAAVRLAPYIARGGRPYTYREFANIIGIPYQLVGLYCGALGEFCIQEGWPLINSMIVNEKTQRPGKDWFSWTKARKVKRSLGLAQADCRAFFAKMSHAEMSQKVFSGIDEKIQKFLEDAPEIIIEDVCSQCDLGHHERCRKKDCACGCRK